MNKTLDKILYLRNILASGKYKNEDKKIIHEIKNDILISDTFFKEIILNGIENCEEDIEKNDIKSATQEIQFIHNFPIDNSKPWNESYFYSIELLSYMEHIDDLKKIKKIISLLAKLQNKF